MENLKQVDESFMKMALEEAKKAFECHEVPVGAVLVKEGVVLARAYNQVEFLQDASAHAELLCLKQASLILNNWRLVGCTLYTTLEPCSMCLGAILLARVERLVWGAPDRRHGACGSLVNLLSIKHPTHHLKGEGNILEESSSRLLKEFFQLQRKLHARK